jgi:hypothetical protein
LAGVACAGACVSSAAAQVVYSHFVIPTTVGSAVVSPNWEVGEYITLAGGAQPLGTAEVQFGALASSPNGEGTLNLSFYNDAGGAPGTLIATFAEPVILIGVGPQQVTFSTGSLSVPGSVWVAVRFEETSGGMAGVIMNTNAPTVGSVSQIRAFREGGVGEWGTDSVGDWMTLRLTAAASCYANCDGSTVTPTLNINDFICFQQKFAAGDSYANCDASTAAPVLNINDFICFQQKFAAGCP